MLKSHKLLLKHSLSILLLTGLIVLAAGSTDDEDSSSSKSSSPKTSPTSATKWHSGGTLHNKSALEWQTASSQDKLATCADFVTTMWQNGNL